MEDDLEIMPELNESEEEEEKFEEVHLDPKEINDLLFLVQSLGCTKTVGNVETYVKSPECIEFLKELYKILRNENPESPLKRLELGEWNVVESDLIKLLVSYPDDRQLAFYTIIVLVSLTEKGEKGSSNLYKYVESLQNYKLSFITSKDSIKVIINHLAECLSKPTEVRNEQHDQMLELITYLFRNLLAIPDKTPQFIKASKGVAIYNTREDNMKDLQRRFLHKLADESVLDAFIYMCQDFTPTSIRKLNLCFLEIFCNALNCFSPKCMWIKETGVSLLQSLRDKSMEQDRERLRELSSRHSKFGSSYKMTRGMDGVALVYHNPFKERIELNKIPGQSSRTKPQRKENMNSLSAHRSIKEIARVDKILIDKIKHFASDVLEHCFAPIIESIFTEFYKDSERLEDHDKTNYFLFQAFFMEYLRYKHYFDSPVLDIDVSPIYGIFQKMNFEYFYRSLLQEFKKTAKKEYNTRELHASIKFCTQYFYIIRDMQNSVSETTKRNAQILLQTVFYREMSIVCRKCFDYWRAGVNDKEFLEDILEFTYLTFKLLEEYSKGKALTVRTERMLKSKKRAAEEEDEENPEREQSEEDESRYVERQLNFAIEFSLMIDADIVCKYCFLLKRYRDNRDEVNSWVIWFMKKAINECEAEWIFYQLEYLQIFDEILTDRTAAVKYKEIHEVVSGLVEKFFNLFAKNRLVAVECLFRVRERSIKNQILSNYEEIQAAEFTENAVELEEEQENRNAKRSKTAWTREEDQVLITNYPTFKSMDSLYELLANLLEGKSTKEIMKRVKYLKLSQGVEKAKAIMNSNYVDEDYRNLGQDAAEAFAKHGKTCVVQAIAGIIEEYTEFLKVFPGAEFGVVPKNLEEFSLYGDQEFRNLMMALGFRQPGQGEWCWRISESVEEIKKKMIEAENHEEVVYEEEEMYDPGNTAEIFKQRTEEVARDIQEVNN